MSLQKLNLHPFYSPDSSGSGTAIEDKALSIEDSIELLGEETTEKEVIELDKDKKKDDKGDDKERDRRGKEKDDKEETEETEKSLEDELEEELEEPDEEKLELVTPIRRKEILAKYPNLFKEFPALENAYYREQAYSEILPTINDAKEAVEKAGMLDTYEKEIMNGSTETLLTAVRDGDRDAFAKVVDNYLPTLFKVDEGAYYHTIGNIIKHTIITMVRDGKESGTDELIQAADVLHQYIFATKTFTQPQKLSREETAEDGKKKEEVDKREVEFTERQFKAAEGDITTRIDNVLKSTVDKNIDPNESMTEYVRKNASRDVLDTLERIISEDTRFEVIKDKLWERAFENDFDSASMDRIKQAYLSKAKTLLPALIRKARNEALKGLGKRTTDNDDTERKDKKGPLPVGRTRSSSPPTSGKTDKDKARAIPKGMTTREYLDQD